MANLSEQGPATTEEGSDAPPSANQVPEEKKKTKTVMRRVPDDHVEFVLAAKPTLRSKPSPALRPKHITDELRRQSARVDDIINSINEYKRKLQDHYRQELAAKGYVEVEVEVTDDGEG
ncbi:hypothetical protein EJB05_29816, partial [Eragrostis curvula]